MNTPAFKILRAPVKATLIFGLTVSVLSIVHWSCVYYMNTYCYIPGFWGMLTHYTRMGNPICHIVNNVQLNLETHYIKICLSNAITLIGWIIAQYQYKIQ